MPCGNILFFHVSYATPYKMDDVIFSTLNKNNFEILKNVATWQDIICC